MQTLLNTLYVTRMLFDANQPKLNDGIAAPRDFRDYTCSIVETMRCHFDQEAPKWIGMTA